MTGIVADTGRKESYWVSYMKKKARDEDNNHLGVIIGKTGSGKSYAGLRMCYEIDSTFNPERIVFSPLELIELFKKEKVKSGQCILWDEAGVGASSRDWQSKTNKLINFFLQTFRQRRILLFMTVPYLDFLDSTTRRLVDATFQTISIDRKKKRVVLKPMLIPYRPQYKIPFPRYLRLSKDGMVNKIVRWHVELPPKWLLEEYNKKKMAFTQALNEEIYEGFKEIEQTKKKVKEPKELTPLQQQTLDLMTKHRDVDLVAKKMKVSKRNVYLNLSLCRKKGYEYDENRVKGGENEV